MNGNAIFFPTVPWASSWLPVPAYLQGFPLRWPLPERARWPHKSHFFLLLRLPPPPWMCYPLSTLLCLTSTLKQKA
eukprot:9096049-Prorocentrum_lima.AAC.1